MRKRTLTKIERLLLIGNCIKAVTAVIGGSMILSNTYPYVTLATLCIGAIANEIVGFIRNKTYGILLDKQEHQDKDEQI